MTEITARELKHDRGHIVARQEILPRPLEVVPSADEVLEKRTAPTTGEKADSPLHRDDVAHIACQRYLAKFAGPEWERLEHAGAKRQRPL